MYTQLFLNDGFIFGIIVFIVLLLFYVSFFSQSKESIRRKKNKLLEDFKRNSLKTDLELMFFVDDYVAKKTEWRILIKALFLSSILGAILLWITYRFIDMRVIANLLVALPIIFSFKMIMRSLKNRSIKSHLRTSVYYNRFD